MAVELKIAFAKPFNEEQNFWTEIQKGDREAFSALYYQHIEALLNYALRFSPDHGLVEDCIQELFSELWQKRESLGQVHSVKAYLFTAIRRKIFKKAGKRSGQLFLEDYSFNVPFQPSIESQIIIQETDSAVKQRIRMLMNDLSALQREIIYLKYFEDLSILEICDMLHLNKKAVYNALSKAMINLRKSLVPVSILLFLAVLNL